MVGGNGKVLPMRKLTAINYTVNNTEDTTYFEHSGASLLVSHYSQALF